MKIYPNPCKSVTYVSIPHDLQPGSNLTVTNNHGDLVYEKSIEDIHPDIIPVDLSNCPYGLYRITIGNDMHQESNELLLLNSQN